MKIKKYPTQRSNMPDHTGHKIDPTHAAHVAKVGGVSCSGSLMSEKKKLPLIHGKDYTKKGR